jgi:hypothetical protein
MKYEEIRATPNHRDRTFTIRKGSTKYRTAKMSLEEFKANENNTQHDWRQYLKRGTYIKVK